MGVASVSAISLAVLAAFSFLCVDGDGIPTTLDGPFKPLTVPLDTSFRGNAVDLPHTDPRLQRTVQGFEPEQISVTLSATYDSVWISWVTGFLHFSSSFLVLFIFVSFFLTGGTLSQVFKVKPKHNMGWGCFVLFLQNKRKTKRKQLLNYWNRAPIGGGNGWDISLFFQSE